MTDSTLYRKEVPHFKKTCTSLCCSCLISWPSLQSFVQPLLLVPSFSHFGRLSWSEHFSKRWFWFGTGNARGFAHIMQGFSIRKRCGFSGLGSGKASHTLHICSQCPGPNCTFGEAVRLCHHGAVRIIELRSFNFWFQKSNCMETVRSNELRCQNEGLSFKVTE